MIHRTGLIAPLCLALLLGACSSPPSANPSTSDKVAKLDCTESEPATGSNIVRRGRCVDRSDEAAAAAREQADAMKQTGRTAIQGAPRN